MRCHRAAGVGSLIVAHRVSGLPDVYVALQLRGPNVGRSGVWASPAGTLRTSEPPWAGAVRETREEMGDALVTDLAAPELVDIRPCLVCDWKQYTFLARTTTPTPPVLDPDPSEVDAAAWVHVQAVNLLPLHPDFAQVWNAGVKQQVAGEPHQTTLV